MPVPELEKIGVTYKFECLRQESYIGESKRLLVIAKKSYKI